MATRSANNSGRWGEESLERRIADACAEETPAPPSEIPVVARLRACAPELDWRAATTRAGWHRLGGVLGADRRPVARHVAEWAHSRCGGDLAALMEACAEIRGFVTRLQGCTHYMTAVTGPRAQDFIQVEVEELQEVVERPLWHPQWSPEDLEDFIDPMDCPRLDPEPVGPPRLAFRRLLRVAEFIDAACPTTGIKRFMEDWNRSSAGESARFCDHWCLGIRDHRETQLDGYLSAKPIALASRAKSALPEEALAHGAALAKLVHGFDHQRGYRFAWYFHMLTRREVSFKLGEAVHADLMAAFDYLPAKDLAVLQDWYDSPYSV